MSNLTVIFSTASGLSFMKAENKDSKRKEKMYICHSQRLALEENPTNLQN